MPVDTEAIARGVLESISDDELVLSLPGTDYRLSLRPTVESAMIETAVCCRALADSCLHS